jgi:hypothetical protein
MQKRDLYNKTLSGNSWNAETSKVFILHCNNRPTCTVAIHVYCRELPMSSSDVMFCDIPLIQLTRRINYILQPRVITVTKVVVGVLYAWGK